MAPLRLFIMIVAIGLTLWPAGPGNAQTQDKSVIGRWQLTAVLDSSEISALDDAEAEQLIGKVLDIRADRVTLGKRSCDAPSFEVTQAETDEYLHRHARAYSDDLGLPNPVTVVNIGCMDVYLKPPKLVVHWQGVFFEARRLGR